MKTVLKIFINTIIILVLCSIVAGIVDSINKDPQIAIYAFLAGNIIGAIGYAINDEIDK